MKIRGFSIMVMIVFTTLLFVPVATNAKDGEFTGNLADECVNEHIKDAKDGSERSRMPFISYSSRSDDLKMVVKDRTATITPAKIKLKEVFEYHVSSAGRKTKLITNSSISFSKGKVLDNDSIKGNYKVRWLKASGETSKEESSTWRAELKNDGREYLIYLDHDTLCSPDYPWFNLVTKTSTPDESKPVKLLPNILPNILLGPGERVPDCFNDASIWQAWIDHRAKKRRRAMESGYDTVARAFQDVAKTFKVSGNRRLFWPGALVQSCLETGFYTFGGDADPTKFNLAGIGIPKSQGLRIHQDFLSLELGVRAFYQHLSVYATGERVDDPLADRTRDLPEKKIAIIRNFITNNNRQITFNDLKSHLPPEIEASPEFEEFMRNYAGTREDWNKYKEKLKGTGGTTFGWAGDPFYGVKLMSLWRDAFEWIEDRCDPKVAPRLPGKPSPGNSWTPLSSDDPGQDQEIESPNDWSDVGDPNEKVGSDSLYKNQF